VKSVPGKLLKIDIEPIEAVRLLSAFGTVEPGFVNLMLSGVINVACDKRTPESGEINLNPGLGGLRWVAEWRIRPVWDQI